MLEIRGTTHVECNGRFKHNADTERNVNRVKKLMRDFKIVCIYFHSFILS